MAIYAQVICPQPSMCVPRDGPKISFLNLAKAKRSTQAFLDLCGFDFCDFQFNVVNDSIPFFDIRGHSFIQHGFVKL